MHVAKEFGDRVNALVAERFLAFSFWLTVIAIAVLVCSREDDVINLARSSATGPTSDHEGDETTELFYVKRRYYDYCTR